MVDVPRLDNAIYGINDCTFQRIAQYVLSTLIHWITPDLSRGYSVIDATMSLEEAKLLHSLMTHPNPSPLL